MNRNDAIGCLISIPIIFTVLYFILAVVWYLLEVFNLG